MFSLFRREVEDLAGEYAQLLEMPRGPVGDLALPCFQVAKRFQKSAQEAALMISAEMNGKISALKLRYIGEVRAVGPYVNFYINYSEFAPLVLKEILAKKEEYGTGNDKNKIVIESPGPNTNKPLHVGHVRNMVLGNSLANILQFQGNNVVKVDIVNDRGIHICKSMLAYKKLGSGKQPDKKSDHFVGDYYVLFAKELEGKPQTDSELRQMLVDWENGKKDVINLWKRMNKWALDGLKETYERLGTYVDKIYYESDHYLEGKKIVMDGLKKGVFEKDDEENIIVNLEKSGLGKRVLLRKDGTSVYLTQDIALAEKRYKDFRMDRMIYVVGVEQIEHFKVLFEIFKLLGYEFAHSCKHLAYGMVNLPEGKMKSREGTVVDADNLMDEVHELAAQELHARSVDERELDGRAEKIAMAAIKFFILKFDAMRTATYDPKVSLSFEGDTGPYVMYTYARCKSMLKKASKKPSPGVLEKNENAIVRKLSLFPQIVGKSASSYNPQEIAVYSLELAAMLNEYYHSTKVVGSASEAERLALVACVAIVLKKSLELLGIETLEQM